MDISVDKEIMARSHSEAQRHNSRFRFHLLDAKISLRFMSLRTGTVTFGCRLKN